MGSNFSHVMFQATIDHIQFGFRYVDDATLLSDDQMALNNLSLLHILFLFLFLLLGWTALVRAAIGGHDVGSNTARTLSPT